ncbi:MAG TPA: transposase [Ktedonobacteraceae bacterium]|jgi:hypothetical protein|nr:transposase [Ktedonobacteraceae bacterium]
MLIIPESRIFDQRTMALMLAHDPLVQRYRTFFEQIDWSVVPEISQNPSRPGQRPHPESAYIKAFLIKVYEGLGTCSRLRRFLVEHPLLVLSIGFRPRLAWDKPYGFDVARTVPTDRWLRKKQYRLDHQMLQDILARSVWALQKEIPGLGETVAFDVKHIYAWVRENNPRESIGYRFSPDRQPKGDPDCKVGVKRSTNQVQADGTKKEKKEYLWGYGSGVATATFPDYGDVVFADLTLPFNEADVTYYPSLHIQTVATLGFFPTNITADAAYDAWYVYQTVVHHGGIAAIALNQHGHPTYTRDADGVPRCPAGLRMEPTKKFQHTNGYRAQRYQCPLLFPEKTPGLQCTHEQFAKKKGCVKDINIEKGGLMRVTIDRDHPIYKGIYCQRSSAERINSQAKELGIERPKVRNGQSVRNLNTLTYIVINLKTLLKARSINRNLLDNIARGIFIAA